ncbi:hypothetical protein N0V88_005406 [Collariella sp. IMI 366227]|nr:hypothetical protein N0V88_005406 [Collariella sp. IMI 366227]
MDLDDDEETLQLKLQAIQARLRLKKIQAAKAQRKSAAAAKTEPGDGAAMGLPIQSRLAAVRDRMERQQSRDAVQVPASPVKRSQTAPDLQTSPQRILLGIDKGLRGADVSLKRVPSQRKLGEANQGQQAGYLRRSKTPVSSQEISRPLSFNERLASARNEEAARQDRRKRVQESRTTAFSVGKQEMEDYKTKALEMPELPSRPQEFSRDQILSSIPKPPGGHLPRSQTVPDVRSVATTTTGDAEFEGAAFEPYSGLHLSKRILPHNILARAVSGKKSYLLKDLLRQVKAPDWSLPDHESDIVVFAIIASKSEPRSHRPGPGSDGKSQQDRGKYMVMTLVDLTYEVELFLFNSGFERFWKLTEGTVLAILNPGILPPPPGREATNRFGLVINSDEDTILEVGKARDIGYCKSIKKDGSFCKSWVNARRTEYCEFHTNEAVRKARSSRIELSTTAGFGGGDGSRGRSNSRQLFAKPDADNKLGRYDRFTQSQYFISTAHRSTDADNEQLTGLTNRKEREEALKRRLAQKEKERDIARRLGELGGGAGKEYMNRAVARSFNTTTTNRPAASSFSTATATSSFSSFPPLLLRHHLRHILHHRLAIPPLLLIPARPTPTPRPAQQIGRPRPRVSRSSGGGSTPRQSRPGTFITPEQQNHRRKWWWGATATKRKRPESSDSNSTAGNNNNNNNSGGKNPLGWGSFLTITSMGVVLVGYQQWVGRCGAEGERSPVRKKTRFVTEKGIREAGRESLGETLGGGCGAAEEKGTA